METLPAWFWLKSQMHVGTLENFVMELGRGAILHNSSRGLRTDRTKTGEIPLENCSAEKSMDHYSGTLARNDTINTIWAILNSLWASNLEKATELCQWVFVSLQMIHESKSKCSLKILKKLLLCNPITKLWAALTTIHSKRRVTWTLTKLKHDIVKDLI